MVMKVKELLSYSRRPPAKALHISCFSLPYLLILNIGRLTPKYWQHVGRSWAAATSYLLEHVEMLSVSRGFISEKKCN